MKMSIFQKNILPVSYTLSVFFKNKVIDITEMEKISKMLEEKDVSFTNNKIKFSSHLTYQEVIKKYNNILSLSTNKQSNCENFKLRFEDPKNSVYLWTIVQNNISFENFLTDLKNFLNNQFSKLSEELKNEFDDQKIDFASVSVLRDNKMIILFEEENYKKLCYLYINSMSDWKSFDVIKEKIYENSFINSELFWFEHNTIKHLFREFQKICSVCKSVHSQEISCYKICDNCATVKKTKHVCLENVDYCYLCKIYLDVKNVHKPLSIQCKYMINLNTGLYIKTRRNFIEKIIEQHKNILEKYPLIDPAKHFCIKKSEFPDLYDDTYQKEYCGKSDEDIEKESFSNMLKSVELESEQIKLQTPKKMFITIEVIEGADILIRWPENDNLTVQKFKN